MSALSDLVGVELGPTSWLAVGQERIDRFAEATDDPQWIHTDRERAAAGPFGTTIAHGFLTLSLLVPLLGEVLPATGGMTVNYGLNRVRFPSPLPAGARIRGRFRIEELSHVPGGVQLRIAAAAEREGAEKPVCVAELLVRVVAGLDSGASGSTSEGGVMIARVASFEGVQSGPFDEMAADIGRRIEAGELPPMAGLAGTTILLDRERGRSLGITFFDSLESVRAAEPAFERMGDDIPEERRGRRVDVTYYEVALDVRL